MCHTHSNRDREVKHLPAGSELHVSIKKPRDLASGSFPALDPSADESLSLLVAHHLHQPGVALVDVLFQWRLQFL